MIFKQASLEVKHFYHNGFGPRYPPRRRRDTSKFPGHMTEKSSNIYTPCKSRTSKSTSLSKSVESGSQKYVYIKSSWCTFWGLRPQKERCYIISLIVRNRNREYSWVGPQKVHPKGPKRYLKDLKGPKGTYSGSKIVSKSWVIVSKSWVIVSKSWVDREWTLL